MFFELLFAIFCGIISGIVTGLIPGIHINLVSALLLGSSVYLLNYFGIFSLVVFIISMSITHTFLDSIPSIFLGAPDSAMAMGVLPGHRFLLKGNGVLAVKLTVIGSFGSLILSIIFFPLSIKFIEFFYPLIKDYIGHIILVIVFFMVFRDNFRLWALFIFLLSGIFGFLVLNLNLSNPLFPMLSGLFGVSTLFYSLLQKQSIPLQKKSSTVKLNPFKTSKALLSGQFSGFLTAMFPGLGSAQAAILSMQLTPRLGDYGFMILLGAINTANFSMSIATLYVLGKARNGSIVAVSELLSSLNSFELSHIILFLSSAVIAGSLSVFLALKISRIFSDLVVKVNYSFLVLSVIFFIAILSIVLSGPLGFFVLLIASFIGLIPAIVKTSRAHAMGCLLLPVMVFFLL